MNTPPDSMSTDAHAGAAPVLDAALLIEAAARPAITSASWPGAAIAWIELPKSMGSCGSSASVSRARCLSARARPSTSVPTTTGSSTYRTRATRKR